MSNDFEAEPGALDAYSAIVTSVAAQLRPQRVATQRIRSRRGESVGSAVVLTDERPLVTNSHLVGDAEGRTAEFADGTVARFEVVGRDPLRDSGRRTGEGCTFTLRAQRVHIAGE